MQGYQLTFYTQQSRKHHHKPVGEWLLEVVKDMAIRGATLTTAIEGIGRDHHLHSAHFFDLADQPVIVTMVVSEEECEALFRLLKAEKDLYLFYVKIPAEFGAIGA